MEPLYADIDLAQYEQLLTYYSKKLTKSYKQYLKSISIFGASCSLRRRRLHDATDSDFVVLNMVTKVKTPKFVRNNFRIISISEMQEYLIVKG